MTTHGRLLLTVDDAVAHLVLSRSQAANTIDLALAAEFRDAVAEVGRSDVRALVISGAGGTFCAGGDVREMAAADDLPGTVRRLAATFHDAVLALAELPAVIVAAVDGPAAGAGLGLALNADLIVASDRAMFLTAYEAIGLTPDSGTSLLLPRAVGLPRATAMSTLGTRLSATEAHRLGMVHEVVAPDDLLPTATATARRLAQRPQAHLPATRALYRGLDIAGYRRHLDAETAAIAAAAATAEAAELILAFASRTDNPKETT